MKRGPFIMPLPLLVTLAASSILMISGAVWMTENLRLQIEELRVLYEDAGIGEIVDVDRSAVDKKAEEEQKLERNFWRGAGTSGEVHAGKASRWRLPGIPAQGTTFEDGNPAQSSPIL
ncbi:hypothetical protein Bbelb_078340 [Branchiostoma belcheri]|nr:hypothetical protein Bbelb_078340 [Branchiostoma belcheri]